MKVVIVEDEIFAAQRLENMIREYDPSIEIVARLESVSESVEWFRIHAQPDLVFLDIHLEDGLSFSIFEHIQLNAPLIFTTAYDEYAIKAFKLRSIDYLQKPIDKEELKKAMDKFREWGSAKLPLTDLSELQKLLGASRTYRERFSVTVGQKIKFIEAKDIAYFFSTKSITFVVMKTKNQYFLDLSLDYLSNELNPTHFFRINRQYLIHIQSIANVHIFPKSRLKIELNPPPQEDGIFVSLDKVVEFKKWIDGSKN